LEKSKKGRKLKNNERCSRYDQRVVVNEVSYGVRAESTGRWNYHKTGQAVPFITIIIIIIQFNSFFILMC
jgi:hypothetical protein